MQKVKELRDKGEIADVETVKLTPDEYNKYLKMAYDKAKFAKAAQLSGTDQIAAACRNEKVDACQY